MDTDKPCNCRKTSIDDGAETLASRRMPIRQPTVRTDGVKVADNFEQAVQNVLKDINGLEEPRGLPKGWEDLPEVHEAHRRAFAAKFLSLRREKYPGGHDGRGIVIAGGGSVYFTAAFVCIRLLRKVHKCELPIEVWHLGKEEMDPRMSRILGDLGGVVTIDVRDFPTAGRVPGGWELKSYAIIHSRFKEVLFLDADQIPVKDPEFLFDEPNYIKTGAILWPDLTPWGWCITEQGFKTAGLPVPGNSRNPSWGKPTDYTPVESGQLLVNKEKCWRELLLALYINEHSNYWYRNPQGHRVWHIYGDKDTFYIAWQKFKTKYVIPPAVGWEGSPACGAFMQKAPSGELIFQHKCQPPSKWSLHGENTRADGILYFDECLDALRALREQWIGHPWDWSDQEPHDKEISEELANKTFAVIQNGLVLRKLTLCDGGAVSGGRENEHHWRIMHDKGFPRLVISGQRRATHFLTKIKTDLWASFNPKIELVEINSKDLLDVRKAARKSARKLHAYNNRK